MARVRIAIIGVGKIALDQHLPVIAQERRFRACRRWSASAAYMPAAFRPTGAAAELYAAMPEVDAVAICTPPHVRHAFAREALAAGKHVMLEKPPAATVAEMHDLTAAAHEAGRVIFSTWHSQYNAGVDEAKAAARGPKTEKAAHRMERRRETLAPRSGLDLGRRQFRRVRSRHQRAFHPHQDRARRDIREIGQARLSRKPRHADRRFAYLLVQRRRGRRCR